MSRRYSPLPLGFLISGIPCSSPASPCPRVSCPLIPHCPPPVPPGRLSARLAPSATTLTCQGLDPIGPLQVVRDEVVAHLEHVEHLVVHHIVGVVVEVPDAAVEAVAVLASVPPLSLFLPSFFSPLLLVLGLFNKISSDKSVFCAGLLLLLLHLHIRPRQCCVIRFPPPATPPHLPPTILQ